MKETALTKTHTVHIYLLSYKSEWKLLRVKTRWPKGEHRRKSAQTENSFTGKTQTENGHYGTTHLHTWCPRSTESATINRNYQANTNNNTNNIIKTTSTQQVVYLQRLGYRIYDFEYCSIDISTLNSFLVDESIFNTEDFNIHLWFTDDVICQPVPVNLEKWLNQGEKINKRKERAINKVCSL